MEVVKRHYSFLSVHCILHCQLQVGLSFTFRYFLCVSNNYRRKFDYKNVAFAGFISGLFLFAEAPARRTEVVCVTQVMYRYSSSWQGSSPLCGTGWSNGDGSCLFRMAKFWCLLLQWLCWCTRKKDFDNVLYLDTRMNREISKALITKCSNIS